MVPSDFYKYSISTDSYTTSPTINQPPNVFSYGAAMVNGKDASGYDVIYTLRGNSDERPAQSHPPVRAISWKLVSKSICAL